MKYTFAVLALIYGVEARTHLGRRNNV